ncbi:hypothetical protein E2562_016008 [Oryza meyeriana var. granulata]|uniref:Uncharacterized protein n=1 Tax=Oryza meyeriana var. granulata TaxID=110450 RepID=A0A6G1EKP0_9ORYZ|nr:hypothetical protein E2562_016008 [Oryza meyeriana var. granulata]
MAGAVNTNPTPRESWQPEDETTTMKDDMKTTDDVIGVKITIEKAAVEKIKSEEIIEKVADAHPRVTGEIDNLPVNKNEEGAGEKDQGHWSSAIATARKCSITEVLQDPPPLPPTTEAIIDTIDTVTAALPSTWAADARPLLLIYVM